MTSSPWSSYRPSAAAPWNLARAWTLRRRAGFGATWCELERDLAGGPGAAVDRVLAAECRTEGVPADFARTADLLGDAAAGSTDPRRLQAWWLYRALFTPDPLLERLTLMWHDHFATSQLKVDDVAAMRRQNATFRRLARGPFGELLREMLCDPALLLWLDAPTNRKGKPNENLARELMELFTLGVGRFTETDVKESARALTGRTVAQGHFQIRTDATTAARRRSSARPPDSTANPSPSCYSPGPRWRTGLPGGFARPFWAKGSPMVRHAPSLPTACGATGCTSGARSRRFCGQRSFSRPKTCTPECPTRSVLSSARLRALERFTPPPSTLLLAEWTGRLGQELFFPPNVGGWPGGRGWLSGRGVVARANFAAALVTGRLNADAPRPDLSAPRRTPGTCRVAG